MKSVKVEKLIEKVEGEATLGFHFAQKKIDFVDIVFTSSRGIEKILEGRRAEDALVINPRVCGICGHAHLIATVKALEACHEKIEISPKAKIIRELTLNFELIQNHYKWLYLTLFPLLKGEQKIPLAAEASRTMAKAIARLAGQYPHNSYAIVGGVVCDPTPGDILQISNLVRENIRFFENHLVRAKSETLVTCEKTDRLLSLEGDLPELMHLILDRGWQYIGKSFDRFIVFGSNSYFKRGKSIKTRIQPHINEKFLQLETNEGSLAKNVTYKHKFYETGPLSRAMVRKTPLIKESHRRYGDSIFSRILARSCETIFLLHHSLELLKKLDLSEPSYIKPTRNVATLTGSGTGAVEAARGSLIHKATLQEGKIVSYEIVTPTQWNLGQGTRTDPGIAQRAMIGLEDTTLAELVFKTFDVCSVCTTH